MGNSSFVITSFLGGEISQTAQGRMDLPSYRISMNVCLNGIPIETGAWVRRPGSRHVGPSRGGARGRGITFAFEQSAPYVMQFTDGSLRLTTGPALVMTNDQQAISSISTANPAVVQTATAHGWSTGNSVTFNSLGSNNPLLQNRQFVITVVDSTHVSIADAITGTGVDGSTLGAFVSGNVTRILEIATNYTGGSWASLRSVQAEERTLLLNGTAPQVLQVASPPTSTLFATFDYGPANFIDGPYLDPITGSFITSNALNGVVTLTLSFQAYDSTVAYNVGDFVTFSGQGYQSLTALNQNNEPDTHPTNWLAVNAGAPVNGGTGFVASDIGRLIRLFSEPALWSSTATYSTGNQVAYTDGQGGNSYWQATGAIAAGVVPGTSTSWSLLPSTAAQWTWAEITTVSGSGLITPATAIGNLSGGGGLSAAFDGNTTKAFASSANFDQNITTYPSWGVAAYSSSAIVQYAGVAYQPSVVFIYTSPPVGYWDSFQSFAAGTDVVWPANANSFVYVATTFHSANGQPPPSSGWAVNGAVSIVPPPSALPGTWQSLGGLSSPTEDLYVGQHYGSGKQVQSATLYPSTDVGLTSNTSGSITVNLRASNSAPSSASNGTLLGSVLLTSNTTSAISIVSNDNSTSYSYVWFEIVTTFAQPLPDNGSHVFAAQIAVAQVQFYSPNITNGSVCTAQIRGPALLYNQTIRTWRLGVYSNTTGWPTCGTYHQGRIWLGGVVSNRFDACVPNGFIGTEINFAPTALDGTVSDSNGISYICDGKEVNQLLWMEPDQQGVLFGTQEGPWLISAPSPGALTPTNIQAARINGPGSANIEPRRAENTLIYTHRFTRKLNEAFADVFSGKFSAPNLSERAKHLTVSGIAEIAYQQELVPTIWARRNDGTLIGATYKRDTLTTSQGPTIIGWHRHSLGSGRLVESICVGPSQNGNLDTLSMVTNDQNTGVRHIEILTDLLDEGFALTDCWFVDNGIVPSSTVVQAAPTGGTYGSLLVNGLWDHNGKKVTAYIAGLDCGDYTVSNGSITVPFGDGLSAGTANGLFTAALVQSFTPLPAVVGFTYTSQGQLVRPVSPADTGARAGPGWAKLTRQHRTAAQMYGMVNGSISFGTDYVTMYPAKLRYPNDAPYPINVQWSGIWRDQQNSIYGFDSNMTAWQITRPNPAFIMAVGAFDNTEDA